MRVSSKKGWFILLRARRRITDYVLLLKTILCIGRQPQEGLNVSKSNPIVVTGGAGFIGSNLVRHLLRSVDRPIVVLDKLVYAGNLDSLQEVLDHPRLAFRRVDICEEREVQSALADFHPSAIIHLAAESHVDRSIDGPEQFIASNVVGTFHVLQSARKHVAALSKAEQDDFRLIHVSTDEVYGELGAEGSAFTEDSPYRPRSPYAASKAASDHLARAWQHTFDLPVIVTNCSNNYGPFQFPEKLIPVVILNALRAEPIPVYGTGENVRDWLHVEDHARALWRVLVDGRPGETYHIGGDNQQRNIDIVAAICSILDELHPCQRRQRGPLTSYRELIRFVPDRPGHDFRYAVNTAKIRHELGWRPLKDFRTGLRETVQWYLDNPDWVERRLQEQDGMQRRGLST